MKRVLLAFTAAAAFLTGCGRTNCDFVRYHDDGRQKPIVAIVPMVDLCDAKVPWDIKKEITQGVIDKLRCSGQLYVIPDQEMPKDALKNLSPQALSQAFAGNEFVVTMELLSHEEIPYVPHQVYPIYSKNGDVKNVLALTLRLQVIDLRNNAPHIILQEVVKSNHMILDGECLEDVNYKELSWGTQGYKKTPVGVAHMRLEKDVANQVEDYVMSRRWLEARR